MSTSNVKRGPGRDKRLDETALTTPRHTNPRKSSEIRRTGPWLADGVGVGVLEGVGVELDVAVCEPDMVCVVCGDIENADETDELGESVSLFVVDVDTSAVCDALTLLLSIDVKVWVLVASEVMESKGVKVKKKAVSELTAVASTDGEIDDDADPVIVNNSFDDVTVFDADADIDGEPDVVVCVVTELKYDNDANSDGVANSVILFVNAPDADGDKVNVRED